MTLDEPKLTSSMTYIALYNHMKVKNDQVIVSHPTHISKSL